MILESRALIFEDEHPQDGDFNWRGRREEKIVGGFVRNVLKTSSGGVVLARFQRVKGKKKT